MSSRSKRNSGRATKRSAASTALTKKAANYPTAVGEEEQLTVQDYLEDKCEEHIEKLMARSQEKVAEFRAESKKVRAELVAMDTDANDSDE